jgi:hypothetical protein
MPKKKTKTFSWKPFEKLLAKGKTRPGVILGVGKRVKFVEIITESNGSLYLNIPDTFALMAPVPTRDIYKVSSSYKDYYFELQNQLKESTISIVSIDGEFLVTKDEVYTFNKKLSPPVPKTAKQIVDDIKFSEGISLSSSDEDSEEDEVLPVPLLPAEDEEIETIIQFDSDDEVEDYFEKEPIKKELMSSETSKILTKVEPDALEAGILFLLINLKDLFKQINSGEFDSKIASSLLALKKFKEGLISNLITSIDKSVDSLRTKIAEKITIFEKKKRAVEKEIVESNKALRDAQKVIERSLALDPRNFQNIVKDTKSSLRSLHLKLAREEEELKYFLRNMNSAITDLDLEINLKEKL